MLSEKTWYGEALPISPQIFPKENPKVILPMPCGGRLVHAIYLHESRPGDRRRYLITLSSSSFARFVSGLSCFVTSILIFWDRDEHNIYSFVNRLTWPLPIFWCFSRAQKIILNQKQQLRMKTRSKHIPIGLKIDSLTSGSEFRPATYFFFENLKFCDLGDFWWISIDFRLYIPLLMGSPGHQRILPIFRCFSRAQKTILNQKQQLRMKTRSKHIPIGLKIDSLTSGSEFRPAT